MTSQHQSQANRANARTSTGPKSVAGRARSAKNALYHRLSLPVLDDPTVLKGVNELVQEIAGDCADTEICELARQIAEAQFDLHRIRRARHHLLSGALCNPDYESPAMISKRRAVDSLLARRLGPSAQIPTCFTSFFNSKPEGQNKFATILSDMAQQLAAMDRYERRALSRRKFAVRSFDAARLRFGVPRVGILT